CAIALSERPFQTRSRLEPRRTLRGVRRVRTRLPSRSIHTSSRSALRTRKRMWAAGLAVDSGEKSGSTLVPAIGERSGFAPSVRANATADAASRTRTVAVERMRAGTARRFYAEVSAG